MASRSVEPAGLIARLGAFRHRNFTLYWISQVATNVGTWMMQVATGWLVLELTNSPGVLGFNAALQAIPILTISLVGGVVADRFDRYRLTVGSQVIQIIPDAALAWLVMSGQIEVWHVFVYSFVSATINALSNPARSAWVPNLVPKRDLLSAMALSSVVWQGSAVIGPAVAGLILANWGLAGSFNLNVASDFLSLGMLVFIRLPRMEMTRPAGSGWSNVREGLLYAWNDRKVRVLLASVGLIMFFARPYAQFMPVFARDVFEVGPQGLGLMLTLPAAGTIAAGFALAFAGRVPVVRGFLATSAVLAISLIGFCITRNFPLALGLLFVTGACSSAATTLANTALQEVLEERLRGRVMSLFMASTWGAWRVASLPLGIMANLWGAPLAVGLSAAALLTALVPTGRSRALWDVEKVASTPHAPSAPPAPTEPARPNPSEPAPVR
ncbi:MAG: hypothetical protein QOF51_2692 [Chloroflexota bacterium]|nr:hypothetical protein [Chloroflexota bacterium]